MSLKLQDVKKIAWLARIETNEADALATCDQLNGIFELIGQMQCVDTTGIEPMPHAQDMMLRLREDVVSETNRREANQQSAPAVDRGLFLVPKVVE